MLFHVTMTHSVEDCPGYNRERMPEYLTAIDKLDEISKQFNVKVHFILAGLPEHLEYALLEANSPTDLSNFLTEALPWRHDYKVTAVEHLADVAAKMKAMME